MSSVAFIGKGGRGGFDEDALKISKKLTNMETYPNLQRSLLSLVRRKGQV